MRRIPLVLALAATLLSCSDSPSPDAELRVFVTSIQGSGDLSTWPGSGGRSGLEGADAVCQARAAAAGLQGSFRAWLSDDADDAYCRLHGLSGKRWSNCGQAVQPTGAGPWVRMDGFPFGGTLDQMVDGVIYAPVRFDELGASYEDRFYATSTWVDGTRHPNSETCGNWTLGTDSIAEVAPTVGTTSNWTCTGSRPCSGPFSLLCMQVGPGKPPPPFAATGKRAFVTSVTGSGDLGSWPAAGGQTGLAAGDAICRSLAAAAGLPGASAFKAWLSSPGTNAVDRLTASGPWVRLDGVLVAATKADLTDGSLFTSVSVSETGEYWGNWALWSGTSDAGLATGYDCDGWTNTSGFGAMGIGGNAGAGWSSDPAGGGVDCWFSAARLLCFED